MLVLVLMREEVPECGTGALGGVCDMGMTVKKRDSARGTIETSVNSGAIDIYPPVLGGGVRTWPGLQSTLMWEKTFAHDVNMMSKAMIVDCHLVGMIPRERALARRMRTPQTQIQRPFRTQPSR